MIDLKMINLSKNIELIERDLEIFNQLNFLKSEALKLNIHEDVLKRILKPIKKQIKVSKFNVNTEIDNISTLKEGRILLRKHLLYKLH